MNDTQSHKEMNEAKFRKLFLYLAALLIVIFSTYVFFIVAKRGYDDKIWLPIAMQHFPAIIGLPMAAICALFIVMILKYTSGPIEFELLSFKFKGASGQIIFWVICFLAITLAIRVLWPLETNTEPVKMKYEQIQSDV